MEKNSRTEMLPGKRDFYHCCKARRSAKQRVLAAISKLRSAFFTGYKNNFLHVLHILYIIQRAKRSRLTDEKILK